jgi:arsenate reductase
MAIIYHNPLCSNSRQALAVLRGRGVEPVVVEYLRTPLTKDQLRALVAKMGVPAKDIARWKEKDTVAEAGITPETPEEALLDAMVAHPILMNRPIVVTEKGARLCRPSETVSELL